MAEAFFAQAASGLTNMSREMTEKDLHKNGKASLGAFDIVAFGFGPSNLALAIAARELDPLRSVVFFEEKSEFSWHPGMMLPGSRMQVPFLKDLVTLRDPTSRFSFLHYLKSRGRLERFVNLRELYPLRAEYSDYLSWVAEHFQDQVRYGSRVQSVRAVSETPGLPPSVFEIEIADVKTSAVSTVRARNVVYACGGERHLPLAGTARSERIIHSSEFLARFPQRFPATTSPHVFTVVGDGQSAGEIVAYLLERYPGSKVHLLLSGYAPRPADSSPFVNEAFFSGQTDALYGAGDFTRQAVLSALRNTNYGVMDADVIQDLYRRTYDDELAGSHRLFIRPFVEVTSACDTGSCVEVTVKGLEASDFVVQCDALIMATGYRRNIDPKIFADVLPMLEINEPGRIALTRSYRARTSTPITCGLYLQGYSETSHGIGDTLLSLLPFRSKEILDDIRRSVPERPACRKPKIDGEYPPKRHLENESEKLYEVLEHFRFATLVSVSDDGEPFITHVPLTLDRTRGEHGILFGHMDRSNPHVDWLDGRPIRAIFHGPNAYLSPHELQTDQLPTWNSIAVHVRGKVRILDDLPRVIHGIAGICEKADPHEGAYRLNLQDPRIPLLIDYIVGFEIEIEELTGRFKLSQDRNPSDRELAANAFMRDVSSRDRDLVRRMFGLERETADIGHN